MVIIWRRRASQLGGSYIFGPQTMAISSFRSGSDELVLSELVLSKLDLLLISLGSEFQNLVADT